MILSVFTGRDLEKQMTTRTWIERECHSESRKFQKKTKEKPHYTYGDESESEEARGRAQPLK